MRSASAAVLLGPDLPLFVWFHLELPLLFPVREAFFLFSHAVTSLFV